jgi:diaminopimelate epimerase
MTQGAPVQFRKMNGLGNDFVVLDARPGKIPLNQASISAICDRKSGIGCDQLLVLEKPAAPADVFMRIYNADGSEASACGNGTRCVAQLVSNETGKADAIIATRAGLLKASRAGDGLFTVDMGEPKLKWDEIPLAEPFHDTRAIELEIGPLGAPILHSPAVINVGNPHAVFFVDDLDCIDLSRAGPMLEHHPLFPERANISLARVDARDHLTLKVWERGAGLTKACGTAACAAAASAIRKRLTDRRVIVTLPGGDLTIEWRESDNHILMTGPAADEGEGTLPENLFKETTHAR